MADRDVFVGVRGFDGARPSSGGGARTGVAVQSLDGDWTLASGELAGDAPDAARDGLAGGVPAVVTGAVHLDLMRAGVIADPYIARNELDCRWVSRSGWVLTRVFDVAGLPGDGERLELVFDGVDTSARVLVNGREAGVCSNMHAAYRFDVAGLVRLGENEVRVEFESPVGFAERMTREHGEAAFEHHPVNPRYAHNMVRKMSCSYGWDWGPAIPSCGLWRGVRLERWKIARIGGVRPLVMRADADEAHVDVHVDLDLCRDARVEVGLTLTGPEGGAVHVGTLEAEGVGTVSTRIVVADPRLWYPVGRGGQPLYRLLVQVRETSGIVLDAWTGRIGLREVELVSLRPDGSAENGGAGASRFYLKVNGERVFCRGANWIPDDCFPGRITDEQYRERVAQARDANMNMLRVWGGGIYESDAFYEACDEMGVMVWQDFLFACAAYHEHEPYESLVRLEAEQNVARLSVHPSLVLWCGNNECQEAVACWGGKYAELREGPPIPWGEGFYGELLPGIVSRLDPSRPYWPGSPYSDVAGLSPRDETSGDVHIWDVWNAGHDGQRYMIHTPRFASEFGFHGPPSWATLARAIPEDERAIESESMVHHNKHAGGQALAKKIVSDWFEEPASFDDWLYLAQVCQARAITHGCEWFRALSPVCSGALYWQYNDCWPVSSWAAVDGDGRPKPLWYATRRFFDPRLVTIRPVEAMAEGDNPFRPLTLAVHVINDSPELWAGELVVTRHDVRTGLAEQELARERVSVEDGGHAVVDIADLAKACDASGFLVATVGERRSFWFFATDRELGYGPAAYGVDVRPLGDEAFEVRVEAKSLVRDLCLFADRLSPRATVSDQFVTLLPGDVATLTVRGLAGLSASDLLGAPVLQTVNRLGGAC